MRSGGNASENMGEVWVIMLILSHLEQEQAGRGRCIAEPVSHIAMDVESASVQLRRVSDGTRQSAPESAPSLSRRI
jgi:hypothetical protein